MDPFAIVLIVLVVLGVLSEVAKRLKKLNILGDITDVVSSYTATWFSLFPYVFFFAGFIVDAINSTYMYSKASLVGMLTVAITAFFGSEWFAGISSNLIGFLPSIREITPAGTNTYSTIGVLTWVGILIAVTVPLSVVWGIGNRAGEIAMTVITGVAVLIVLAGNNLLGNIVPAGDPVTSSSTYGDVNVANVCATPGLSCVQTSFAPVGILLNTSILASHFFEAVDTGNTSTMTSSGIAMGLAFALELAIQWGNGCTSSYKYGIGSSVISLAIGLGSGATAYYTMKRIGTESFTVATEEGGVFHPPAQPQKEIKSDKEKLSTKIVVGPQPDTNAPVDDLDQFVCEAYKDGELITSTIVD